MRNHQFIAVVAVVALLSGCASRSDGSPTFTTRPATAEPRLAFLWSDQISSWKYLGSEPKEFANPSHVGPSDEVVVTTSEGEVIKYQAANGEVRWRKRLGGVFHAGAVIGSTQVYVANLEGELTALDLNTGEEVWTAELGHSIDTRGSHSQGRLFVSDAADRLHAFDAKTGELLWRYARDTPEFFTVKGSCTPVVDGDAVLCGFSDGRLSAIQIDSGELIWEVDLSGGKANFTDVDGTVLLVGNRIYAVSYAGGVYALDRRTGAPIWRTEVESASDFTLAGDQLFVSSALGRVMAIDANDGTPSWGFKLSRSIPGSIASFGPYLVVFTTDGPLYVLDGDTGYLHLKWAGTSGFLAPAESGSSRLYALTNRGQLFAMKLGY